MADSMRIDGFGVPPKTGAIAACLILGSIALLMLGLQPLLLGSLAEAGRLDVAEVGYAATSELLAIGIVSALAGMLLKPHRLRLMSIAACLVLAAANFGTIYVDGMGIVLLRAVAGSASGLLVWVAVNLITRGQSPERLSGIFVTLQTLMQFALAATLPVTLLPIYGANVGLFALGSFSVLAIACTFFIPDRFEPLPKTEETTSTALPISGIVALLVVFLYLAAIVGLWVYIERVGVLAGVSPQTAGLAVAVALAAQVVGGFAATALAGRVNAVFAFIACGLANIALVGVFALQPGATVYLLSVAAFGFIWLFALPFQVPLLIEADPSRRSAMLMAGAQLLGCSAGPMLTSAVATDHDMSGVLDVTAVVFVLAVAIAFTLHLRFARAHHAASVIIVEPAD